MPRTRNINKTSIKRKGKDVFFRLSYTVDRKGARQSEAKKATLIKEVMAIIERYDLSILSVLEEHPFMLNEATSPHSPECKRIPPNLPYAAPELIPSIDLVTPVNSDHEDEVEDDLGFAPKKKVSLECDEPLNEEDEENIVDAIVFNIDNLFAMQKRCRLQIDILHKDMEENKKEIQETKASLYTLKRKVFFPGPEHEHCGESQGTCPCLEIHEVGDINEADVPPTSPPTPPDTQEID